MINCLNVIILFVAITGLLPSSSGQNKEQIRGWNILSNSISDDIITINSAKTYNINHLQLSHDLVMDFQELRDPERQKLVNELITRTHSAGIEEVVVWDHALYNLKYYPNQFKAGPGGTINLDNPAFWEWKITGRKSTGASGTGAVMRKQHVNTIN